MIFETFEAIKEIKVYQKEKLVSQLFEKVDHFEKISFSLVFLISFHG